MKDFVKKEAGYQDTRLLFCFSVYFQITGCTGDQED